MLTHMHNSVISLQTSSAKEQVAIDLDHNRISADLYGTQEMVKVCKQEAFWWIKSKTEGVNK